MDFRLLGSLAADEEGLDRAPARPKQRALLAALLLRAGEVVSGDDLLDAIWGERPPPSAASALQGHVSALRKLLGAERIETQPPGYRLRLQAGDTLDLEQLEQLASFARGQAPAARAETLTQALALFRGEPLADFRYSEFARSEGLRLGELRLDLEQERLETELELRRHLQALPALERLVAEHPLRERLRAALALALYRAGRQAQALHALQEGRRLLAAELGLEPAPLLQELERQILNHDPRLEAPDLFAPAASRAKPGGIVTFLAVAAEDRRGDVRELVERAATPHGGVEAASDRRASLRAFARARDAVAAAVDLQQSVTGAARLRVGVHSAEALPTEDGYAGFGVGGASSVCRAAHGGQILLSRSARDLLRESPLNEMSIRDLGEHRLTDLTPAQRLFQLVVPSLAQDFPPPRTLEQARTNLPSQPTSFVGRRRELDEIAALVKSSEARVLTLTGAAGTGKTRLALQAAAELIDDFDDGVFLVELAPLSRPELVLPAVARVLGIGDGDGEALVTLLERHLLERRLLLVLDNFEHLLGAAEAVTTIVSTVPGVRVFATSRAPLRVPGEQLYPVSPLALPTTRDDAASIAGLDAVTLFTARARAVRPDFELTEENAPTVAELCRALDGLPLAIELAATRVGVLPPRALLERLDARLKLLTARPGRMAERHRTLRAAIDWSHDLLRPEEQRLYARLSVFAGGCTLAAAEQVCGVGLDVVDGLTSLVELNLVASGGTDVEPRFAMLETIREHAAGRLAASGEADELRRRHAESYLALAEAAEPHLRERPGEWLERLEQDHENLRTALDWLESTGNGDGALRLAGGLWRYWYLSGRLAEGLRYLDAVLAADGRPTPARAKALIGAAVMAVNTSAPATAREHAEAAIALTSHLGDAWGNAYATLMLAAAQEDDLRRSEELNEQSARAFRELGDEHSALLAARNLARTYERLGNVGRAQALHEENLRRARKTGNDRIEASTLGALAMLALAEGRVEDAETMLRQSLRIHHALGDVLDTAVDLCRAAYVLAFEGETEQAALLLAGFEALGERVANRRETVAQLNEQTLAAVRARLDNDQLEQTRREGRRLRLDDAVALAVESLS